MLLIDSTTIVPQTWKVITKMTNPIAKIRPFLDLRVTYLEGLIELYIACMFAFLDLVPKQRVKKDGLVNSFGRIYY